MKKNLYLFMGLHKTGSTTLQYLCKQYLSELNDAGFSYPMLKINNGSIEDLHPENHTRLCTYLFQPKKHDLGKPVTKADIEIIKRQFTQYLDLNVKDLIIIAEGISSFNADNLLELSHFFSKRGYKILPFCIVRPPGEWLNSMVAQIVAGRRGPKISIDQAITAFANHGAILRRRFDNISKAMPYTKFFTLAEIINDRGSLTSWFSNTIGVPVINQSYKANQRLSGHTVRFASMLNAVGENHQMQNLFLNFQNLHPEILQFPGNPFKLTESEIAPIEKIIAQEETWFRAEFNNPSLNNKPQFAKEVPSLNVEEVNWVQNNLAGLQAPFDKLIDHYIKINSFVAP